MRGVILVIVISLLGLSSIGQQAEVVVNNSEVNKMAKLPILTMPAGYSLKSLPMSRDNSVLQYFPAVFNQSGWSCNQASSVGYLFTYEINAIRDLPATINENLYPPSYVWNFLNNGDAGTGVSYFDSWEVIRTNGIPSIHYYGLGVEAQTWVSGYDIYYNGMKNRTQEVYNIFVGDEEGLQTLKHWLTDHLDGSPNGGVANFQIASGGMKTVIIPAGQEEEGKHIMVNFGVVVGHAMTFVGWNDSVMHDFNNDGLYTNDIDITDDGIVDMRDWEKGAMLTVNSWGDGWGDRGKVYVPYRLLALDHLHGGIWERIVTVMRPKKEYSPKLTMKASITHTKRNQIKIVAGVARNFAATEPEVIIEYPFFNFLGGDLPMQGTTGAGNESLEFGLDITPFLNYIDPNIPAKFFLEVYHQENDNQNGSGKIDYFSIMDYGGETVIEETSPETNVGIRIRELVRVAVIYDPIAEAVSISSSSTLPEAEVGTGYLQILQAEGGTPPYRWTNMTDQYVAEEDDTRWDFPYADKILDISDTSRLVVDLGFSFPFYGTEYTQVTVLKNGGLVMGSSPKVYPYVIDPRMFIFQNAGIFPFYADLQYLFSSDGVYRVDENDGVVFAWDATLTKNSGVYDPKFGVKLFIDGRIETGYFTTAISADWNWIAGVSAGDMKNYTLPDINSQPLFLGGTRINYTMNKWPSWLYFSQGGALLGVPEDGESRVFLPVHVEDSYGLQQDKTFSLHINGTSSSDAIQGGSNIEVFPNPFRDRLNLDLENISADKLQFNLYSIDGKNVFSREISLGGSKHIEINLSELQGSGNFFYQLRSGDRLYSGKVVRQK